MAVAGKARWILFTLVVLSARAAAQPSEPPALSEELEAARLTEVGSAAWRRGDHALALTCFRLAYRVFPSPRLYYNMGLALDGQHRPVEAALAYERFLAEAPDAPEDTRTYATGQIADLDQRVGRIEISASPPGAHVSIDGRAAGPRGLRVAPGRHSVLVRAEGRRSFVADIDVAAGQRVKRTVDLVPWDADGAPAPPVPEPMPTRGRRARSHWWAVGALGVVAVGVAALLLWPEGETSCPGSDLGCVRVQR